MTQIEFKDLFDNHFDAVRNYTYYLSGDQELATDITQESFLKIWEKQRRHKDLLKIKGLLFKIAHDLFISYYRKQKVATSFVLSITEPDVSQSPEEKIQYLELKNRYEICLNKLPDKQRVVFLMSRIDNMKYHEIASANNISVKAVEKRMKNALSFLKKELNY